MVVWHLGGCLWCLAYNILRESKHALRPSGPASVWASMRDESAAVAELSRNCMPAVELLTSLACNNCRFGRPVNDPEKHTPSRCVILRRELRQWSCATTWTLNQCLRTFFRTRQLGRCFTVRRRITWRISAIWLAHELYLTQIIPINHRFIVYYARREQKHTDKTPKTQIYTTVHTSKNDKNH